MSRALVIVCFPLILLGALHTSGSTPSEPPPGASDRSARGGAAQGQDKIGPTAPRQIPKSIPLGPAPRLDPITRFLPPIDPWVQSGLGWGDVATDDRGEPLCMTNHAAATSCDPSGPRPFVHAGFDALPAPDRTVRASATGRVVSARRDVAPFVVGGPGESGGVVVIEHDLDGDPSTRGDLLQTIYEHVNPLVAVGDIVSQGQVIARTSVVRGQYLHFGVRLAPFDPADPDIYRTTLPPTGATGCPPCFGRQLPVPAFPERWEDPLRLLRNPSNWAELLEGDQEGGADVVETPDGYLVGGWTRAANIGGTGADDMWLVKLDAEGHILSQHAFGGPGSEEIRRLVPTADGGYVALARTRPVDANHNSPLLIKFDSTAEHIEWQTTYVGSGNDWANDIRATSDGGFVIAGATDPCNCGGRHRGTVVKVDAGGAVQWAKSFAPVPLLALSTDAVSVVETADGGYVGIGTVNPGSTGSGDILIFRLDPSGQPLWFKSLGAYWIDTPGQIEPTSDGGFVTVGTKGIGGVTGLGLFKLAADGSLESEKTYTSFGRETGARLVPMPDGGFVVAGHTFLTIPPKNLNGPFFPDLWLVRLDSAGQIVKQRGFEARSPNEDVTALRPTRDGGFIVTGGQDNNCSTCPLDTPPANFVVIKTDADLEVSHGCGVETTVTPFSSASLSVPLFMTAETFAVTPSPADATMADTAARAYACDDGAYGPPPVFQSASAQLSARSVSCDLTRVVEDLVCVVGVPGAHATLPVILSGTYEGLQMEARVTDADSTPDRDDIVEVHAGLQSPGNPFPFPVPLVDDGSTIVVPQVQRFIFGEDCVDDPVTGTCYCQAARFPTVSGDLALGDSIYGHQDNLFNSIQSPLLIDCATAADRSGALLFAPGTSLDVSFQATDRIGNVSVWPVPIRITTGINSEQCSGDACACCILQAFQQIVTVDQCAALEGMPSPQFPCGTCIGAIGVGCGP